MKYTIYRSVNIIEFTAYLKLYTTHSKWIM